jgi:lysophospholipase L1-like esterase
MAIVNNITANCENSQLSQQIISRQWDDKGTLIQFAGYPQPEDDEELIFKLKVWMKESKDAEPKELTPILLDGDQWLVSNFYTQLAQTIKFQLWISNESETFVKHSPIFAGHIGKSLSNNGEEGDIDVITLFDPYKNYVDERVEELIVAAGAVQIDASLRTSGAAADAKATGDAIDKVNGRLQRQGENVDRLNDNIANYNTVSSVSFTSGGISGTGQIQGDSKRIRVTMASMPVMHSGDAIEIGGVFEGRIFANTTQGYTDYNIISGDSFVKGQFVIPENADGKYIGILLRVIGHENEDVTSYVDTVNDYVKYYHVEYVKQIANEAIRITNQNLSEEEQEIARTNINAASNDGMVYEEKVVGYKRTNSKFWDISSGTNAVLTDISSNSFGAYSAIAVTPGEVYRIKSCQGKSHKARIWTIVDDNYNIIAMAPDNFDNGYDAVEETFTVPENGTKLVATIYSAGGQISAMLLYKKVNRLVQLAEPLSGKKLSLLGDSISAYAGTIPSGNEAYYTGSNSGVSSPEQMWWKILCDRTGMVPLVINGWSGSGINWQTDSAHVSKVPMSDDSRCNGLHDGTTMPDVIIIAGGVNDYTYAQSEQNEPLAWDGKTVPGYTEPTEGKKVYNSFTEAYVAMIKKLQTNYPNAIIVALSTWFTMRGTDNGYTLTHTVGQNIYSQQDYNDKIRFVAEQMHIPYIDVSNIGFNRNNFYPTYAQDSSTIPTHTNAAGQKVMGEAVAEKLVALVKGFLT